MYALLTGVKIIDLTTIVLGPYATQLLGDFGAEVIKVEAPSGDLFRAARPGHPGGDGAGFIGCNRNKASVVLDLTTAEDRAALMRLIADADVVVHNMRPRAAARLGIDYATVKAARPGIVYCTARGFGDGPLGDDPAYDDCIQSASGVAWLNRDASGAPRYVPTILCDKVAGLHLAFAIASGIASRERSGEGLAIDIPMYEAMVAFMMVEQLGGEGFVPAIGPTGYGRLTSPDRRPVPTSDGHVTIMPYTTTHWQAFLRMIGRDDLADDPRVTVPEERARNIDMLYATVAAAGPARSSAEWIGMLRAADIPCAPVNSIDDLLTDDHLAASGMFETIEHPREGTLRSVRSPFTVQGRAKLPDRPAPSLGADTDALLNRGNG